jgi:hypothetical protein
MTYLFGLKKADVQGRIPTNQLHLQLHRQSHRHAPHAKCRALLYELIGLVIGKESVQGLH